jgi:hypothetical protein
VAFAGIIPSTQACNAGYFCRVGVLRKHGENGLQLRLMRALEARAPLNGWCSVVSDMEWESRRCVAMSVVD